MNKLIVAYGLPGSGKTFYGEKIKNNTFVINLDKYIKDGKYPPVNEMLNTAYNDFPKKLWNLNQTDVYIDGLICTHERLFSVVKEAYDFYCSDMFKFTPFNEVEVVYWKPDIEKCKDNIQRRNDGRNVDITLNNIEFEEISENSFVENRIKNITNKYVNVKVNRKEIYMDTNWCNYFLPLIENSSENCIYSKPWSLGGTWGDCWGNLGTISPEPQPKNFKEFDDLLMKVCPNISYLQYKILYDNCVSIDEDSNYDYYGGHEYQARFKLNVKDCYDWLVENNLINI